MKKYKLIFGIDVSKNTLDIYNLSTGIYSQVLNTEQSIKKWIHQICVQNKKEDILCVFEPTGCYSHRLLNFLGQYSIAINLVNPLQSNGFTNALGIISKDDRQAAKTLALMGQNLDLPLNQHQSENMQRRKQLLMGINALKKQQQMLRNQLHTLDHQIVFEPKVVDALKATLDTVDTQLLKLEKELNDLSDEEYEHQLDLITSVVGIGKKTAHLLISATGGLQYFDRAKQLSKFTGVVPSSHRSGSSINKKGRITKRGNSALRASLFMAAKSAIRFNKACKDLYQRLRRIGRAYKQAIVAVMNKLIKQAFGVVQSGISFDNNHYLKFVKTEK